jgi:serine/threonine protein phosphatase PrpC
MGRGDRSGACAVVALLRESQLLVAHCGDCRAVLAKEGGDGLLGEVLQLTSDHKPERPDEKARVEAAGGFVTLQTEPDLAALHRKTPAQLAEMQRVVAATGRSLGALCGTVQIARVMGSLAVSRSLGDVGFKGKMNW